MNAQPDTFASSHLARPLLAPELPAAPGALRAAITAAWLKDETEHVRELLEQARLPAAEQAKVQALAADLVTRERLANTREHLANTRQPRVSLIGDTVMGVSVPS